MANKKTSSLVAILLICIGGILGWVVHDQWSDSYFDMSAAAVRQGGYTYINPLLECEIDGSLENKSLEKIKNSINKIVTNTEKEKPINHISVYFRDLNNGPWFGINEKENFSPASLLKMPVMLTYYKAAETETDLLSTELRFTAQSPSNDTALADGASYTIDELIRYMIVDSDNDSFNLLVNNIDYSLIEQTHRDLGLTVPTEDTPEDFINVKDYASLFRVLYNSSYLNRSMSERALALLSEVTFNDGIAAGVPPSLKIANKYGVTGSFQNNSRQLHDCGIVYYPDHPYLLCIMTRGDNTQELRNVISEISSTVYKNISESYTE